MSRSSSWCPAYGLHCPESTRIKLSGHDLSSFPFISRQVHDWFVQRKQAKLAGGSDHLLEAFDALKNLDVERAEALLRK